MVETTLQWDAQYQKAPNGNSQQIILKYVLHKF